MMIFKVIGIGLITVAAVLILRPYRPDFAFLLSALGAVAIFFIVVSYLESYFALSSGILADNGVSPEYFGVAIKALGIGYISEFAADLATDSGQSAIASKIIFAGKACMFITALPLIKNLLDLATELVGK